MAKQIDLQQEKEILIKDIPLMIRLEDLCYNVGKADEIMKAVLDGDYWKAAYIASEILRYNDRLIEERVNKDAIMEIINKDKL